MFRTPLLSAKELTERYGSEPYNPDWLTFISAPYERFFLPVARGLRKALPSEPRLLEIGPYVGGFLGACRRVGITRVTGLEINDELTIFLRDRGYQVIGDEIGAVTGPFDAVCVWNCFDQLPEPRAALLHICNLLRDDGLLVVRFPNAMFYEWLHSREPAGRGMSHCARILAAYCALPGFTYRIGYSIPALERLIMAMNLPLRIDTLAPSGPLPVGAATRLRTWAMAEERLYLGIRQILFRLPKYRPYAPWLDVTLRKIRPKRACCVQFPRRARP